MADLSALPQVDAVLREADAGAVIERYGREPTAHAVRRAISVARDRAREGAPIPPAGEILRAARRDLAARRSGRLAPVLNATGVVLHTNLGRAPLSAEARDAVTAAAGYCSLEYDLGSGARGSRTEHVGALAAEACGAEAATVVNNCAAALVLVLAALATDREAIVSRGELIEIGGSFRLPEVMGASGARLREVGTTNRTTAADYRAALGDETGLIMKVHRSNYRVVGFAAEPRTRDLAELARGHGVPFLYDLGSGLLREVPRGWTGAAVFADEPHVATVLEDGADLVVFSGDKLLGGPQAGVIAGRRDLVERCARHPLARAVRIDKLQRAALEVTLEAHLRAEVPVDVPVWAMLATEEEELRARAEALATQLGAAVEARPVASLTGGGALPGGEIASWALATTGVDPDAIAAALRSGEPRVVARVEHDAVVLDLRTVPAAHDDDLVTALRAALAQVDATDEGG